MPRRRRPTSPVQPVITLLTDFGVSDSYVAEIKAVLYAKRAGVAIPLTRLARPIDDPILLPIHPATPPVHQAEILHIDHFGNATINVPAEAFAQSSRKAVQIGNRRVPFARTYADVPEGKALALIGSSGLLEVAVRNGHAAKTLKLNVGDSIQILS